MARSSSDNEKMRQMATQKLLESALKVFAARGYHASTMAEIAKKAKVSKGLAYHYFKSKEDLLVALAERRLHEWAKLIEVLGSKKKPEERLKFLVDFVFDELVEKTDTLRFYNSLYLTSDGLHAMEKAMKKYHAQFEHLSALEIQLFKELGFKNPELEALFMRTGIQGIAFEYMLQPKSFPLKMMRKELLKRLSRA